MKVFIPAYFITSGHSVQKWKGTDMESMRDTKRIMEREIKKGSTPLSFEQMEIDTNNYQEITSEIPWNRNSFPVKTGCLEKSSGIGAKTGDGK